MALKFAVPDIYVTNCVPSNTVLYVGRDIIHRMITLNLLSWLLPCCAYNRARIPQPRDIFYKNVFFEPLIPFAGIYALIAHCVLLLSKPFPNIRIKEVYLNPNDQFLIPENESHVAIVTGSNTGIGYETASELVHKGYQVIIACRSRDKGVSAAQKINSSLAEECRGKAVFLQPLDLSSLVSVEAFYKEFERNYSSLNILVNNAGINTSGLSIDNFDLCFQTNFIGHYLLTRRLIPSLLRAKNTCPCNPTGFEEKGRVVNLSSVTHHFASCNEARKTVDGIKTSGKYDTQWWIDTATPGISNNTYKESKLAALLMTHELNSLYANQGLRAISCNPGSVNSDIWRHYPRFMDIIHKVVYLTPKQGSKTSLVAAVGNLPKNAVYLQPYWQPFRSHSHTDLPESLSFKSWNKVVFPFTEMLGPYVGYTITDPRLPNDVDDSAKAMWSACADLVGIDKDSL